MHDVNGDLQRQRDSVGCSSPFSSRMTLCTDWLGLSGLAIQTSPVAWTRCILVFKRYGRRVQLGRLTNPLPVAACQLPEPKPADTTGGIGQQWRQQSAVANCWLDPLLLLAKTCCTVNQLSGRQVDNIPLSLSATTTIVSLFIRLPQRCLTSHVGHRSTHVRHFYYGRRHTYRYRYLS